VAYSGEIDLGIEPVEMAVDWQRVEYYSKGSRNQQTEGRGNYRYLRIKFLHRFIKSKRK
jgi:hypothetical protein